MLKIDRELRKRKGVGARLHTNLKKILSCFE